MLVCYEESHWHAPKKATSEWKTSFMATARRLFDGSQGIDNELSIGDVLMITRKREGTKKSERGIALIIALLTLLLVSAISIGLIAMSNTETNISANFRDEQTAFFAARAGTEEIRDRLRGAATNSLSGNLPAVVPGNTNGVLYVTNPLGAEAVAPWT